MKRIKCMDKSAENIIYINNEWLHSVCDLEEFNNESCFYYYDREYNKFEVKRFMSEDLQLQIDIRDNERFVKLFQYCAYKQYESLVELINNNEVTRWFSSAHNELQLQEKYSQFLDWNNLHQDEKYRLYLKVYPLFIEWCKSNDVNFNFVCLSPPKNYLYSDTEKLKRINWEIPRG